MITLTVHVWQASLTVVAEETPGYRRRLTGDPFAEDGSMPLLVCVLGKEAYIGTAAAAVAYENTRAILHVLGCDQDLPARALTIASLLGGVVSAVQRRYPQEELRWILVSDGGIPREELALAGWRAGLADAQVSDAVIADTFVVPGAAAQPGSGLLLAAVQSCHAVARLAVATDKGWKIVDEQVGDEPVQDPYTFPGNLYGTLSNAAESPLSVGALRAQWLLDTGIRATVCEPQTQPALTALIERGSWVLKNLPASDIVACEQSYWRRLATVCADYRRSLGDYRIDRCIVLESGQRAFVRRFENHAQRLFEQDLGLQTEPQSVEQWSSTVSAPMLDADYALCLAGSQGPLADRMTIAARGTLLPYRSEHMIYLQRSVQQSVSVQLSKLDALTGRPYPFAAADVALHTDMKRNTAVRLAVAFRQCGLVEVSITIPDYQFREDVLIGQDGSIIPDRGQLTGDAVSRLLSCGP